MPHHDDLLDAAWRKSSRSASQEGACVELARIPTTEIAVRDSKDPKGPVLRFDGKSFREFLAQVRTGSLNL